MSYHTQRVSSILKAPRTWIAVFLLLSMFGAGWFARGTTKSDQQSQGQVVDEYRFYDGIEDDISFSLFWQVWDLVQNAYLHQPIAEKELFYGAISGMVESLNDPYSVYFDPREAKAFTQELEGEYSGIGAEIGKEGDYIVVVAPLTGSPAQQAGLMAGDFILAVNGEDVFGVTVDYAVSIIRGESNTPVTLTIEREELDDFIDIEIVRQEIKINSVDWQLREDNIMYIELSLFNEDTTTLFQDVAQEILTSDVDGIVLDLRNNPGGLLTEAINVAGFWIEDDIIVYERVGDMLQGYAANGTARLKDIPTVALVDTGSASGSEILAGALQDYDIATIIGEQTFGKGSVQEYYSFDDGSALKITTAEWLTPAQQSINAVGITPDLIVEYTMEDYEQGRTPQLDAAIRTLTQTR